MATRIRGNTQIKQGSIDIARLKSNFLADLANTNIGGVDYKIWNVTSDNKGLIRGIAQPISDYDAANKQYVDSVATGLDLKASCRVATTAPITLSGTQTIDGVALVEGDRVLVKSQDSAKETNGIYVVAEGAWVRSIDADGTPEHEVTAGMFTFIEEGSVNANTGWVLTSNNPITVGTTELEFSQFSGAGTYTAGYGMTLTGGVFAVKTSDFVDVDYGMTTNANKIRIHLNASGGLKFVDGKLAVEPTDFINTMFGLEEAADRIQIKLASVPGLQFDGVSGAISVKANAAKAIVVEASGVGVKLEEDGAISFDGVTGGLQVNVNNGITINASNQLDVDLATNSGLEFSAGKLKVNPDFGIELGVEGVKVTAYHGITVNANGVGVKQHNGIQVDTDGVKARLTANGGIVFSADAEGSKSLQLAFDDVTIGLSSGNLYVKDGGITEAKIGTAAVTVTKIGTGAVTEDKIGAAAVTATKIGLDAVNTTHIDWGSGASQVDATDVPYTPITGGFAPAVDTVAKALEDLMATGGGAEVVGEELTVSDNSAIVGAITAPESGKAIKASSIKLFLNGLRVMLGTGKDYTYNATTRVITFEYALSSGDVVLVDYKIVNA